MVLRKLSNWAFGLIAIAAFGQEVRFNQVGIRPQSAGSPVGSINLYEQLSNGVNTVSLKAPNSLASSYSIIFPTAVGTSGDCLVWGSSGQLTNGTCGSGGGAAGGVVPSGAFTSQTSVVVTHSAGSTSVVPWCEDNAGHPLNWTSHVSATNTFTFTFTPAASGNCFVAANVTSGTISGITSIGGMTGPTISLTNDTNVTLTAGVNAIVAGWTGTLAKARMVSTTVHTDQANTYGAFLQNFASATMTLPQTAGAAPTVSGRIQYNTTNDTLPVGANGVTKLIALGPTSVTALNLAQWTGPGILSTGLAVSQSATADAVVQRDSGGGIVAGLGLFTALSVTPSSAGVAIVARRGTSGQSQHIQSWASELGSTLSYIDSAGKFPATMLVGDIPVTNLNGGSGASGSTCWKGDGTWGSCGTGGGGGGSSGVVSSGAFTSQTTVALTHNAGSSTVVPWCEDAASHPLNWTSHTNGTNTFTFGFTPAASGICYVAANLTGGTGGNVNGPGASAIGDVPTWANTAGTLLGGGLTPYSGSTPASFPNTLAQRTAGGDLYAGVFYGGLTVGTHLTTTAAGGVTGFVASTPNFTGKATGYAGIVQTYTFPATRGTNLYYGIRSDIADTLLDGSAAYAVYNAGTGDGIYVSNRGAASGATTPTGIAVTMNDNGSGAQNSAAYAGYGVQIWDYTSATTNGTPLVIRNMLGGANMLARFENVGNGQAYVTFRAGSSSDQEEGLVYQNRLGSTLWQLRKNGANDFQLIDSINARVILSSTAGASSMLATPNGINVSTSGNPPTLANGQVWYTSNELRARINGATVPLGVSSQVYNVRSYGAAGDGTTLDRTAIQAALDACQSSTYGGIVSMPPGIYAVDGNLMIGNGNGNTASTQRPCSLEGSGNGTDTTWTGATVIRWTGSAPGSTDYIVKINGPSVGGGVSNLTLDVNSKTNLRGILIENVSHFNSQNLSVAYYATIGMVITSRSTSPPINFGSCDNKFDGLKIVNNIRGGSALLIDGYDTTNGMGACSNNFYGSMFWHDSGTEGSFGVKLGYADNNRFTNTNIYSFASTGTGTVATTATLTSITGTGTSWTSTMTGSIFRINGADYTFTYASATTGTISPAAASTLAGVAYTVRGLGLGIHFVKGVTLFQQGFPTENHFHNTSAHNGAGGTVGTGSPNIFTNWNMGDCSFNCDPYAALGGTPATNTPPMVTGTARTQTGLGAIRQINPTSGTYANYWMWGDDINGTQLYSMKRGAPSGNGLEVFSYDDVKFTNPGVVYHGRTGGGNTGLTGRIYSNTTSDRYALSFERFLGTEASPSAVTSGTTIGAIALGGYNGSGQSYYGTITAVADGVSGGAPTASSLRFGGNDGTLRNIFYMNGFGGLEFKYGRTLSALGTLAGAGSVPDGSVWYCTDCAHASNPCTASSTGAFAKRLNGAFACN